MKEADKTILLNENPHGYTMFQLRFYTQYFKRIFNLTEKPARISSPIIRTTLCGSVNEGDITHTHTASGLSTSTTEPIMKIRKYVVVKAKREVGLLNAVNMTVGVIIGAGIFVSPKGVLANSGSVGCSLLIWIIVGLFCMIGAACYIELGTTFPKSGKDFTYVKECFGDFPAFLYLWVNMVCITPGTIAVFFLDFCKLCSSVLVYWLCSNADFDKNCRRSSNM
ncbi:hypothetical protein JTE90_023980 [Oedothorax gibbosus]|uniref:Uncharacterized protein n=1 Tax=Oedothorax gibbosus TaxID=931172 RepID=A0AAV6UJ27_9ARAC|nr:hypothetical protein JTE90_023980 [Oedothorax gibbosus]